MKSNQIKKKNYKNYSKIKKNKINYNKKQMINKKKEVINSLCQIRNMIKLRKFKINKKYKLQ